MRQGAEAATEEDTHEEGPVTGAAHEQAPATEAAHEQDPSLEEATTKMIQVENDPETGFSAERAIVHPPGSGRVPSVDQESRALLDTVVQDWRIRTALATQVEAVAVQPPHRQDQNPRETGRSFPPDTVFYLSRGNSTPTSYDLYAAIEPLKQKLGVHGVLSFSSARYEYPESHTPRMFEEWQLCTALGMLHFVMQETAEEAGALHLAVEGRPVAASIQRAKFVTAVLYLTFLTDMRIAGDRSQISYASSEASWADEETNTAGVSFGANKHSRNPFTAATSDVTHDQALYRPSLVLCPADQVWDVVMEMHRHWNHMRIFYSFGVLDDGETPAFRRLERGRDAGHPNILSHGLSIGDIIADCQTRAIERITGKTIIIAFYDVWTTVSVLTLTTPAHVPLVIDPALTGGVPLPSDPAVPESVEYISRFPGVFENVLCLDGHSIWNDREAHRMAIRYMNPSFVWLVTSLRDQADLDETTAFSTPYPTIDRPRTAAGDLKLTLIAYGNDDADLPPATDDTDRPGPDDASAPGPSEQAGDPPTSRARGTRLAERTEPDDDEHSPAADDGNVQGRAERPSRMVTRSQKRRAEATEADDDEAETPRSDKRRGRRRR